MLSRIEFLSIHLLWSRVYLERENKFLTQISTWANIIIKYLSCSVYIWVSLSSSTTSLCSYDLLNLCLDTYEIYDGT